MGGIPAAGTRFGAAHNPESVMVTSTMIDLIQVCQSTGWVCWSPFGLHAEGSSGCRNLMCVQAREHLGRCATRTLKIDELMILSLASWADLDACCRVGVWMPLCWDVLR